MLMRKVGRAGHENERPVHDTGWHERGSDPVCCARLSIIHGDFTLYALFNEFTGELSGLWAGVAKARWLCEV